MNWNEFQAAAARCHKLGRADYLSDRKVESALRAIYKTPEMTLKEIVKKAYSFYKNGVA